MAIAELLIIEAWKRFQKHIRFKQRFDDPKGHGWEFLAKKLLPVILSFYDADPATLLRRFHGILEVRHKVVHRAYVPTPDEVNEVLSTIRHLISIWELPSRFRGNWQLRPGMPEPV
jgi:hypothetical protein